MKRRNDKTFNKYVGLNAQEAVLWSELIQKGPLTISQLAVLSKCSRPTVYKYLQVFKERGLVSTQKRGKRRLFEASSLNAVERWYASRQRRGAKDVVEKKNEKKEGSDVQIYRGRELSRVWEMVLDETPKKGIFYRYDGYGKGVSVAEYIPQDNYARIEAKKVERFVITNQDLRKSSYKKRIECASRMLPLSAGEGEQGVPHILFGEKLAMRDKRNKIACVIHNKNIVEYHRELFKWTYRQLPE